MNDSLLSAAIAGQIPIICVTTTDLWNCNAILQLIAGRKTMKFVEHASNYYPAVLYITDDKSLVTTGAYKALSDSGSTLIVINGDPTSPHVFDAGEVPVPPKMLAKVAAGFSGSAQMPAALKGLTLKLATELLSVTAAKHGVATPALVRQVRGELYAHLPGLFPVSTEVQLYAWPAHLRQWLDVNKPYFLHEDNVLLVPRGILLDGDPGVGKSMASKAIAHELGVPLYRLDIATTLDKYIGASEQRISRILATVDREEPCVLLIDEVEKIFTKSEDSGVSTRIMSQLLWWLSERTSRVFVVMTTNDKQKIPAELYRSGRIDKVLHLPKLSLQDAITLSQQVFSKVLGRKPKMPELLKLKDAFSSRGVIDFSHASVWEHTVDEIKKNSWKNS